MLKKSYILNFIIDAKFMTQSGGVIPPTPTPEKNTAWNKGRKCFRCLGAPNNLIRPWSYCMDTLKQAEET